MILTTIIRDLRDLARLARAQIEVTAEAHNSGRTRRSSLLEEIESWGLETFHDDEEAISFILDDDFGLPEGFEWTEPAVYLDEVEDE